MQILEIIFNALIALNPRIYFHITLLILLAMVYLNFYYHEKLLPILQHQFICTLVFVNLLCCLCFYLFSKIKTFIFGPLKRKEIRKLQEIVWNYVFHKCIFVLGVLNVQCFYPLMCWIGWLSILGSMHIFVKICIERSTDAQYMRNLTGEAHIKILILLLFILVCCGILVLFALPIGYFLSVNYFGFLVAEVIIVLGTVLQAIIQQQIRVWDLNHPEYTWENKFHYLHYNDLIFSLLIDIIDLLHHIHLLVWVNMFLSMASLVLLMKLRYLYQEIFYKLDKHFIYTNITHNIKVHLELVSYANTEKNREQCAICWEFINPGRKLKCGHIFHAACLYSWFEDHQTCPICRENLSYLSLSSSPSRKLPRIIDFFSKTNFHPKHTFNYIKNSLTYWLPNFTIDKLDNDNQFSNLPPQELHLMLQQIRKIFPNIPMELILLDFLQTNSIQHTIENLSLGNYFYPLILTSGQNISPIGNSTQVTQHSNKSNILENNNKN